MAPGAAPTTSECDSVERNGVRNVFEGPEKKLVVRFTQRAEPLSIGEGICAYHKKCNVHCRSTCKAFPSHTLRCLRSDQVKAILNAARCTMLSVVSNVSTDAYLLSESSMFVSDFRMTLKTCGTTTLLRALPVILRIVFETLGFEVLYVQFSRTAYLFPEAQTYPHDSFDHEMAYLDHELATKGKVFEVASHNGSTWYLYFACLQQGLMKHCYAQTDPRDLISSPEYPWNTSSDQALEVYMFDLDPVVMNQFMFHDRRYMIGSDNVRSGTTSREIKSLLGDYDIADGYNFAPCGYSMNALKRNSYYTIHVSPERDGSYVSFETTANMRSFASLVAAVVKLFRPGRFTVSYVLLDSQIIQHEAAWESSWTVVSRLLSKEYSMTSDPSIVGTNGADGYPGCFASVTSFQKLSVHRTVRTTHLCGFYESDALEHLLLSVAVKYDAYFGRASVFDDSTEGACESEDNYLPKYVVDLGRVARNWSALRTVGPQNAFRLRYAVRSNTEKGVLALLSGLDVDFEAVDASEVDLLASLGVSRTRIVLVTPVLTTALVKRFHLVGTVALFDVPAKTIHTALLRSNVHIEVRVVDDSGLQDLNVTLERLAKGSLSVTSVALDTGPDSLCKITSGRQLWEHVSYVRHMICPNSLSMQRDLALHVGETWIDGSVSRSNGNVAAQNAVLGGLLRDGVVSIDASRALLADSISLFTRVVGRRGRRTSADCGNKSSCRRSYNYYLNDGAYGAFSYVLMSPIERALLMKTLRPRRHSVSSTQKKKNGSCHGNGISRSIRQKRKQDYRKATLYGPTCDALDWVWEGDLPVLDVGDSLLFRDIGAYSSASRTAFNGYGQLFDVSYTVAVGEM